MKPDVTVTIRVKEDVVTLKVGLTFTKVSSNL